MTTEHDMAVAMATEIGKQVPVKQVYEDTTSPAAKQIGYTTEDIIKVIRLVGLPIQWLAVQQDKYRAFIEGAKSTIPEERRVLPAPQILGPILESIRYEINDEPISVMFRNLLGSAMDVEKLNLVHPSFVNIIKNLSPDEAKILDYLRTKHIEVFDDNQSTAHLDGSEELWDYDTSMIELQFTHNVSIYFDMLFSAGLVTLDNKGFSLVKYKGKIVKHCTLILSRTGKQLMSACYSGA